MSEKVRVHVLVEKNKALSPAEEFVLRGMVADTLAEFVEWVEKYESEVRKDG